MWLTHSLTPRSHTILRYKDDVNVTALLSHSKARVGKAMSVELTRDVDFIIELRCYYYGEEKR